MLNVLSLERRIIEGFTQFSLDDYSTIYIISVLIGAICTFVIILAVAIDFILYHRAHTVKYGRRSFVETGSMFAFFLLYFIILQSGFGRIKLVPIITADLSMIIGSILLLAGCIVNVLGRIKLKHQWANQVVIYQGHQHINSGIYLYLRHPLYGSLIWMFIGASFIFLNYIALISVCIIFIPMMYYRARQEERALVNEFSGYRDYISNTWMFFPGKFLFHKSKKQIN